MADNSKYEPPSYPPQSYQQDVGPYQSNGNNQVGQHDRSRGYDQNYNQGYGPPQGQYPNQGNYYGPPQQQGYYGPPQGGMMYQQGPPPQGYYADQRGGAGAGEGCLAACLGALACCCCLDILF